MKKRQPPIDPFYSGMPVNIRKTFSPMGLALRVETNHPLILLERDINLTEEAVLRRHYRYLRRLVEIDIYRLAYGCHPSATVETISDLCEGLP